MCISGRRGPRPQQPGSLAAGSRSRCSFWCKKVHKLRLPLRCVGRAYRGGGGPDHNSQDPLRQEAAPAALFGARRHINLDPPSTARDVLSKRRGPIPQQPGSLAAGSCARCSFWRQEEHKLRLLLRCAGHAYRGGGGPDHNSQDPSRQEAAAAALFLVPGGA
ncbi:hypothetical protein NDU88_007948 [Pleurodeles waltl]|uniref:Uncharacterized protein n=1 Tax=Pleurodeles waltl TaxID=8319 RepID=A0AAV7N8B1_PLEWA|nr:hypothetical protein NDU88_007948 [Pleurodeles waltl]